MSVSALVHLAEECGELTQAATKIARFGADSTDPTSSLPKSNRTALIEEAGDVIALVKVLVKAGLIDKTKLKSRVKDKQSRYERKYL